VAEELDEASSESSSTDEDMEADEDADDDVGWSSVWESPRTATLASDREEFLLAVGLWARTVPLVGPCGRPVLHRGRVRDLPQRMGGARGVRLSTRLLRDAALELGAGPDEGRL
jgi:hypothetical protein